MVWGPQSGRTSPLPKAWKMIRANVLRRDNWQCVWIREDTGRACGVKATDVDHINDPNDHRHANLRSLCGYHHKQHTAQQGGDANAAKYKKQKSHPGITYLT